jgi:hypothetical protein
MGDAVRGDLGRSAITNQRVTADPPALPVTFQIMVMTMTISWVWHPPRGDIRLPGRFLLRPDHQRRHLRVLVDTQLRAGAAAHHHRRGRARAGYRPPGGQVHDQSLGEHQAPASCRRSPWTLGRGHLTRLLRTDMIATLQEDHVVLAKSKGLPTSRILFRHALRPSSFSLMTVLGLQMAALLSGAVVIEEIFALPGLGRRLFVAVQSATSSWCRAWCSCSHDLRRRELHRRHAVLVPGPEDPPCQLESVTTRARAGTTHQLRRPTAQRPLPLEDIGAETTEEEVKHQTKGQVRHPLLRQPGLARHRLDLRALRRPAPSARPERADGARPARRRSPTATSSAPTDSGATCSPASSTVPGCRSSSASPRWPPA